MSLRTALLATILILTFPCSLPAQQTARAGNDCRTPIAQPCATIVFEHSQWQNFERGITDIFHHAAKSTTAVRRDGSSVHIGHYSNWYRFPEGTRQLGAFVSMYSAPQDEVIRIDHNERTISRGKPLIWHDRPYRRSADGDADCSTGILHSGTHFKLAGKTTVAGIPVVKWVGRNNQRGENEVYLAPSLDCIALKTYSIHRNRWYIPFLINSTEAVSVELGEPRPELFSTPSNYRQVRMRPLWRIASKGEEK